MYEQGPLKSFFTLCSPAARPPMNCQCVCLCVLAWCCRRVVEWSRTLDVRLDVYVFYMRHTLPYRLVLGSVDCNLAHSSGYDCPLGLIKLLVCRSLVH